MTDLKLQKLQMDDDEENNHYNENGDGNSRNSEKTDGVWGKVDEEEVVSEFFKKWR